MLMFAGHETTASALTWALYCVHQHPDVGEALCRELATLGNDAGPAAIARLPYLGAVCQETLRLYPGAVGVPKALRAPLEIMGSRFEPGTQLVPCFYLTHRRADLYPEPTRFRPERFLERQYSPYEYLPFGAGPRRCIGMTFAQFEMAPVFEPTSVGSDHNMVVMSTMRRLANRHSLMFAGPPRVCGWCLSSDGGRFDAPRRLRRVRARTRAASGLAAPYASGDATESLATIRADLSPMSYARARRTYWVAR